MAVDFRQKDKSWRCAEKDGTISYEQATLATLQDIRDELKAIRQLASCYRIPRALDALHSMGVAARRRKKKRTKRA